MYITAKIIEVESFNIYRFSNCADVEDSDRGATVDETDEDVGRRSLGVHFSTTDQRVIDPECM